MSEKKEYTFKQLEKMNLTKFDLFRPTPEGYDYALPQQWLNEFSQWCKDNGESVTYDGIRSTTCWDCNQWKPAFAVKEVRQAYLKFKGEN